MCRALALLVLAAWLGGCVAQVRNGAIIGGLSGAAAGAGIGWIASDEDLAGSGNNPASGPVELPPGESIAVGALIGLAFGAVVGAMVGHQNVPDFEMPEPSAPPPPVTDAPADAATDTAAAAPASF